MVQSAIATALNVSNDNVIDLPISYSKDLVVYNSSKIAGYTFSSVPQFFEIDNVYSLRNKYIIQCLNGGLNALSEWQKIAE